MDRKKIIAGLFAVSAAFSAMLTPYAVCVQAQAHEIEIPNLEEGTYVKGEALVSMSTTQAAALTKEGRASFDSKIRVEECWEFGAAHDAQSDQVKDNVALVSTDT